MIYNTMKSVGYIAQFFIRTEAFELTASYL